MLIERNMFVEAEKKLKLCEKLCREAFEDDGATEEDVETELAHIKYFIFQCSLFKEFCFIYILEYSWDMFIKNKGD